MEENKTLLDPIVGYLIFLSNGQKLIVETNKVSKEELRASWVTLQADDIFEIILIPVSQGHVNIEIKRFSENPFCPKEVNINTDKIMYFFNFTRSSDLGKAFIQSRSGIQLVS